MSAVAVIAVSLETAVKPDQLGPAMIDELTCSGGAEVKPHAYHGSLIFGGRTLTHASLRAMS
jgi:hypothetical protein